jgi:hypothetical protein
MVGGGSRHRAAEERGNQMAGHSADGEAGALSETISSDHGSKTLLGRNFESRIFVHTALAGIVTSVVLLVAGPAGAETPARQPIPIAIADFDYRDSSGEVQDQTKKHRALLQDFTESLRRDLARGEKYHVVTLPCGAEPCTAARSDPAQLIGRAREAGAALLLYGGIHKMSTLVQWAKVQIVDVRAGKLVLDRLLTFRGDDERAWQRAESFLAADLAQCDFSDRDRADGAAALRGKEQP